MAGDRRAWAESTKSSAISCLDGPAEVSSTDWPTVIPELDQVSRWQGAIQGWWLWAPCASNWPAHSDDRYAGPWDATTEIPILVIGTRYDPNTGYQNAERVTERFGNAVLLTHDGYGHVSDKDHSTCIEECAGEVPRRPRGPAAGDGVRRRPEAVLRLR